MTLPKVDRYVRVGDKMSSSMLVVLSGRDWVSARRWLAYNYPATKMNPRSSATIEVSSKNIEQSSDEIESLLVARYDTILLVSTTTDGTIVKHVANLAHWHPELEIEWRSFEFEDEEDKDCPEPDEEDNLWLCPIERRKRPKINRDKR